MKIKEFIENFQPEFEEYCPCIIDEAGDVFVCEKSHLFTLIELSGEPKILEDISNDVSPLFYLMSRYRCVVVDYENQIYNGKLNEEQLHSLQLLEEKKLIQRNRIDIKGKIAI